MAYEKAGESKFDAEQCLANWKLGTETRANQVAREREDLQFQVPELMWDPEARDQRKAASVGGVAIPARPCLSVPKTLQPLNIVRNQMQNAHLGVSIRPISPDASDDTAEIMQDLYRSIERDPDAPASHARNWAFDRALQAGTGWYRVNTAYDEASTDPFDQKILIERILYQDAVIIDPAATKPDYSDAQWAMVTYWKPLETFRQEFPESTIAQWYNENEIAFDFQTLETIIPGWVKQNGESKSIQVGEYFCKHTEYDSIPSADGSKTRQKARVKLMRYLVAPGGDKGLEVIEENLWNGPDIPLIPAIGTELQPFDSERRIFGMIRPVRDSAKIYNYAATTLVERTAMEPKAPFVGQAEQFEGFEEVWRQANTRNFPYLPYKGIINGTQPVGPPQRMQVDASSLSPSLILLEQADQMIQDSSATPNPVLGKARKDQSGKAISALQSQSEVSNSGYIQNFSDITMRYEAKVILGMIPNVYDRPGRIAHIMDTHGDVRKVMLNAPFVDDNGTPRRTLPDGRPMPVQGAVPGMSTTLQMPQAMPGPQGKPLPKPKVYDLSKGIYGVAINIEKSKQSQLEEGSEQLAQFIEKDPELGVILAPLFLKYQSWSGAKEAAELAKEYREMKYPQIGKPKDGQKTPDQLEAELKAAQAQMEQMRQAGAELQKQLETKQAEQQGKLAAEQMKAQASMAEAAAKATEEEKMAQIQAALDIRLQEMKDQSARELQAMKEQAETERLMLQQQFQAIQAQLERVQSEKMAVHADEQQDKQLIREEMSKAEAAESGAE